MEQIFDLLLQWDRQLLLSIQGHHSSFSDLLWAGITEKYYWIPLYLLMLYILFRYLGWQALYVLVALTLLITLSDQLTSSVMKPLFGRLRPCHDPEIGHLVRIVTKCGGTYGFVSSHAANSFAVCTFFWLIFKQRFPWIMALFVWPLLVSYSRIYLGVHYPLDVLGGAVTGAVLGYLIFLGTRWFSKKIPFQFRPIEN